MVASLLGTNAPNGTVGVHGWLRNAAFTRYYPGVITGFTPAFNGMTIWPAYDAYNACLAQNANGDMDVIALNSKDGDNRIQLSAPTSSGQARCYAIVVSKSGTATTTANDGIGTVSYTAVPGSDTYRGSELPPTDAAIRRAVPDGASAFICVVSTVRVNYGDTSLNASAVNASLQGRQGIMVNGQIVPGYQCISHPRTDSAYLVDSHRASSSNEWSYRKYSDGSIELYMLYAPGGSYSFDSGPVWHTAYIPKPPDYPVTLYYDGSAHGVWRGVSLEDSSNGRTGIGYTGTPHSVAEHETSFGGIRITDRDSGSINNPVLGLHASGWWY